MALDEMSLSVCVRACVSCSLPSICPASTLLVHFVLALLWRHRKPVHVARALRDRFSSEQRIEGATQLLLHSGRIGGGGRPTISWHRRRRAAGSVDIRCRVRELAAAWIGEWFVLVGVGGNEHGRPAEQLELETVALVEEIEQMV